MHISLNKSATIFIFDESRAYSGYLANLLKDNFLSSSVNKISKKPYFILENKKRGACESLVSFAKEGDNLLLIGKKDNNILDCAKALGLITLEVSGKDSEIFCALKEIGEYMSQKECLSDSFSPPFALGLSHSCFKKFPDENEFSLYKENGISHIEICFGGYNDTLNIDFKGYKALADKYDIKLWSYHLPFLPFSTLNVAGLDETVRNFTVSYFKELIKEAKRDADISIFVIHPSGELIHEDDRKASMLKLKKSLNELCDFAQELGVTIAVENLPRTCLGRNSSDMYEILSFNPNLKMCFDLNHTSGEKAQDIINRFANKIVTIHVSDFLGNDECHLMPLEGNNDWGKIINALIKADYKGPFLYEISRGVLEDGEIWAKESWHTKLFKRNDYLKHSDVKENFYKLMNGY